MNTGLPISLTPIGRVRCAQRYRYEAARQASIAPENEAWIELRDGQDLRDGLRGLEGFERIWVIYELHLNETWHPLVQPPREDMGKLGVFATRAPHRPNRIGLSCVLLLGIEAGRLHIGRHDLLDGTPVLDIKPYVPYADAFPQARAGWVDEYEETVFSLEIEANTQRRMAWVAEEAGWDLLNFLRVQLRTDPTDGRRKRIERAGDSYRIAFRTWRLDYRIEEEQQRVVVDGLHSGYALEELAAGAPDPYNDKEVHRAFNARFGTGAT